ncbi:MAG: DUF4388 domain-containing protein [Desulfurivibrionaceae bacterium]
MSSNLLEAQFSVSDAQHCPLYERGDEFFLSGYGLSVKNNKPVCFLLAREIAAILLESTDNSLGSIDALKSRKELTCGGCTGMIKFTFLEESEYQTPQMRMMAALEGKSRKEQDSGSWGDLINTFSFFQILDDAGLEEITGYLNIENYDREDVIIHAGEPGRKLYMIVDGRVSVIDSQGNNIAELGRGEIFGEMSLFTGQFTCATIKVIEEVKLLSISGRDLSQLFIKKPFLHMAFSRIMAQRVSAANTSMAESLSYGMSGQLNELALPEILQMLHENMKTGAVLLELARGEKARIVFSEGEIVKVEYGGKTGEEAFFALLKEHEGRFTFTTSVPLEEMGAPPLGSFMKLLMDGMRNIDEEESKKA